MFTALVFAAGPDQGEAGKRPWFIVRGTGKTPYTAIRAMLGLHASVGYVLPEGVRVGLDVTEESGPLLTAYGETALQAAEEARAMLKKASRAGGR